MMGRLYATARLSEATPVAESFMLGRFDRYCSLHHCDALTDEVLVQFLDSRLPFVSPREIYLEAKAIRRLHIDVGLPDPQDDVIVAAAIEGLQKRAELLRQVPLVERIMERIADANRRDIIGARDLAIIHLLFEARLTMIHICRLRFDDIERTDFGCTIRVMTSRGKVRFAELRRRANPKYCPVAALERWLDYTKGEGLVFKALGRRFGLPLQTSGIERILDGALKRAGINIKYAKRTVLTLALIAAAVERGESDEVICDALGYSRTRIVRRWRERAALHLQGSTQRLGL